MKDWNRRLAVFGFGAACLVAIAVLVLHSPSVRWSLPAASNISDSNLVADESGNVYLGNYNGTVDSFDSEGRRRWSVSTGEAPIAGIARSADDIILASLFGMSTNSGLAAVSASGELLWTFFTGREVLAPARIGGDGSIYFGSYDSNFYALNPNGSERWRYVAGGQIAHQAVIAPDGSIGFIAGDIGSQNIYSLDATGTVNWRLPAGQHWCLGVAGSPDGGIVFGARTNLVKVSKNGVIEWQAPLLAYSPQGALLGSMPASSKPLVTNDGTILITTANGELHAFSPEGELRWRYFRGRAKGSPRDVVPSANGFLVALEEHDKFPAGANIGAPHPTTCAVVELSNDGVELWRIDLKTGLRRPRRSDMASLNAFRTYLGNRQLRELSSPVQTPYGDIFVRTRSNLHSLNPTRR